MIALDRNAGNTTDFLGGYRPPQMRTVPDRRAAARRKGRVRRFVTTVLFRWSVLAIGLVIFLERSGLMPTQ